MKGTAETRANLVSSLFLEPDELEEHEREMEAKYIRAQKAETRYELYRTEDAEILVVGFGIVSRVLRSMVDHARAEGVKVGLFRPVTLWPFPSEQLVRVASRVRPSVGGGIEQRADGGRRPPGFEWKEAGGFLRTRGRQRSHRRRAIRVRDGNRQCAGVSHGDLGEDRMPDEIQMQSKRRARKHQATITPSVIPNRRSFTTFSSAKPRRSNRPTIAPVAGTASSTN